jgi:hypothetical protein
MIKTNLKSQGSRQERRWRLGTELGCGNNGQNGPGRGDSVGNISNQPKPRADGERGVQYDGREEEKTGSQGERGARRNIKQRGREEGEKRKRRKDKETGERRSDEHEARRQDSLY